MDDMASPGKSDPHEGEELKKVPLNKGISPYHKHLGIEVSAVSKGQSVIKLSSGERLRNVGGIVHGGAIVSAADAAGFVALSSLLNPGTEKLATVELKVNFLMPVRRGAIEARGRVVHKGRNIAVCEADVFDGNGKLIAKSMGTYKVVRTD